MNTRKSIEDVDLMLSRTKDLIEKAIEFSDALIAFQKEAYEPALKDPFCFRCGEKVERKSQFANLPWHCDKCKTELAKLRALQREQKKDEKNTI
jgi:ribosomal protein L37AE/L43A